MKNVKAVLEHLKTELIPFYTDKLEEAIKQDEQEFVEKLDECINERTNRLSKAMKTDGTYQARVIGQKEGLNQAKELFLNQQDVPEEFDKALKDNFKDFLA